MPPYQRSGGHSQGGPQALMSWPLADEATPQARRQPTPDATAAAPPAACEDGTAPAAPADACQRTSGCRSCLRKPRSPRGAQSRIGSGIVHPPRGCATVGTRFTTHRQRPFGAVRRCRLHLSATQVGPSGVAASGARCRGSAHRAASEVPSDSEVKLLPCAVNRRSPSGLQGLPRLRVPLSREPASASLPALRWLCPGVGR